MRSRVRNASPMGDMQRTTCKFSRQRRTKKAYFSTGLPVFTPASCMAFSNEGSPKVSESSSAVNKLGTSPVFKMPFTSSKKDSRMIWVSSNMNTVGWFFSPANSITCFMSSFHSATP